MREFIGRVCAQHRQFDFRAHVVRQVKVDWLEIYKFLLLKEKLEMCGVNDIKHLI